MPIVSDVDCEGGSGNGPVYTGIVRVMGPDEYGPDRDGGGLGSEQRPSDCRYGQTDLRPPIVAHSIFLCHIRDMTYAASQVPGVVPLEIIGCPEDTAGQCSRRST